MKKLLLATLLSFLLGNCFSQYLPVNPTTYGANNNRVMVGIAILLPTGCGKPGFMSLYSTDSSRVAFKGDTCNNKMWWYNPKLRVWKSLADSTNSSGNADSLLHISGNLYALKSYVSDSLYKKSDKVNFINIIDLGGIGDGITNQTAIIDSALSQNKETYWPTGTFYSSFTPINSKGSAWFGPGVIITDAVGGGVRQWNIGIDKYQMSFGQEYLSHFHNQILNGQPVKLVWSGDSNTKDTIQNFVTGAFRKDSLWYQSSVINGVPAVTVINRGYTGENSVDWRTNHLANDMALNPDLYIWAWGTNDPLVPISIDSFRNNLRSGLTIIRAAKGQQDLSILLMPPTSSSDAPNHRDEIWLQQINAVIRQAARDFQCAYFDQYEYWLDSRNGAANQYMDSLAPGRAVHSKNVFNAWINTKVFEFTMPMTIIDKVRTNPVNAQGETWNNTITAPQFNGNSLKWGNSQADFAVPADINYANGVPVYNTNTSKFEYGSAPLLKSWLGYKSSNDTFYSGGYTTRWYTRFLGDSIVGLLTSYVPKTTTVAGFPLSGNITLATLSIGAELISGGANSYNASVAKTLGIQPTSVTNAMLAGSIANSKLANSTISGIALGSNLASLTATDGTVTFTGPYTGAVGRTLGINLSNPNSWATTQTFPTIVVNATLNFGASAYIKSSTMGFYVNDNADLFNNMILANATGNVQFRGTIRSLGLTGGSAGDIVVNDGTGILVTRTASQLVGDLATPLTASYLPRSAGATAYLTDYLHLNEPNGSTPYGIVWPYLNNAAGRSWRASTNQSTFGDWQLQQETGKGNGVFTNALYFDNLRNAKFYGDVAVPRLLGTSATPGIANNQASSSSINSNSTDLAGNVTFTATANAGSQVTITFAVAYTNAPFVILTSAASQFDNTVYVTSTTTTFTIFFRATPSNGDSFTYNYMVAGK